MKKELLLEGTLRVYWGLKNEVHLKANETPSYWRSFNPDDEVNEAFDKKVSQTI